MRLRVWVPNPRGEREGGLSPFVVLLWLVLLATPALAWVDEAHREVGRIAWRHLRPQTRSLLEVLLRHHPREGLSLPDACILADHPHVQDTWHWTNRPIFAGLPPQTVRLPRQDCLWALRSNLAVLASERPLRARAEALAWVCHLVGDMHQPLHCASRHTPARPLGDRGGNLFFVRLSPGDEPVSLHRYWDLGGGAYAPGEAIPSSDDLPPPPYDLSFEHWLAESHKLARTAVYAGVQENLAVPPGYAELTRETSRRRVGAAGYRLAWLLESTFP